MLRRALPVTTSPQPCVREINEQLLRGATAIRLLPRADAPDSPPTTLRASRLSMRRRLDLVTPNAHIPPLFSRGNDLCGVWPYVLTIELHRVSACHQIRVTPKLSKTTSLDTSAIFSSRACATSIRSNGSRWSLASAPAT